VANNQTIAFASNAQLDVRHVSIHEALNDLFQVTVMAVSSDDSFDLDAIVGKGAAIRLERPGRTRVWAGVCASAAQVQVEPAPGVSTYHIVIMPTFWRTTQRRGSRIFQHMTTPAIVQKVLAEWQIVPDTSLLHMDLYKTHEYCVQYDETDYAFISRLLEDAGITFYFNYPVTSGKGDDIVKLVLNDSPQLNPQRTGVLTYGETQDTHTGQDFCASVTLTRRLRAGSFNLRDVDFRMRQVLLQAPTSSGTDEDAYEQYSFTPGSFWWEPGKGGDTPVADDKGIARTDIDESKLLATRTMDAHRRSRQAVSFVTNALDLCPGFVVGINQEADTAPHPRSDLGSDKKLLLVSTTFDGTNSGEWTLTATGVFAQFTYRPERHTPRPRIYGVQSAIVVGPSGQDIYTDEFGRVRVQFPWDREGTFDDKSSCWMRVSQSWAGGGFGTVLIPRVGHEVLVEFFEGDPDRPVVTGRVYNATTTTPYKLPDHQTQSGWKSDSSPGGGGYNEIKFEDMKGSEMISVQAQKDLSYVVNNSETSNIGSSRSVTIGGPGGGNVPPSGTDTLSIGMTRTTMIGQTDTTSVGTQRTISVGPNVGIQMTADPPSIILSTGKGGASITISGPNIFLNATGEIHHHAANELHLSSQSGTVLIQGGPMVQINPGSSGPGPGVDVVPPASPPTQASPGASSGPPYKPSGGGSIPQPGGIQDVQVDDDGGIPIDPVA
jgi:type VI secretion system secreted protein VgrG